MLPTPGRIGVNALHLRLMRKEHVHRLRQNAALPDTSQGA
jgi:hypothetical protein